MSRLEWIEERDGRSFTVMRLPEIGAPSMAATTKPGVARTSRAGLTPVRLARVTIRRRVVAVSRPA